MIRTGAAALILTVTAALSSRAQLPPPTCNAPLNVQAVDSLAALPVPIRDALLQKYPDIVDRNRPFDSTDNVMYGAHFHRFAFAWRTTKRFVIVTESGGFTYSNPIYIYATAATNTAETQTPPELQTPRFTRAANLCAAAEDALTAPPVAR